MVAVLLMAIVVLVSVDLGMFKDRVEVLVTDLLERELRIDGEMHAYVGTNVELYVEDVYLANPDWADNDAFVTASKIHIIIDAWSLVRGPIVVERMDIDGVRINVEKNDAGGASWVFTGLETAADSDADEVILEQKLPLILDHSAISDTQVSYISPQMQGPLLFIVDSLQSSLDADVLRVELSGFLNDTPLHFVKATSPFENLLTYENVSIELSGNIGEITVRGSALVDDLLAPRRPRVELNIEGPSASYVTDILSMQPITSGPLEFSVSIEESGEEMIASVSGAFGEFDLDVDGRFQDIQELHDIDLNFAAEGPDIGTIIRLSGRDYTESDSFDIHGRISRSGPSVTIENVLVTIGASNMTIEGFFGEFPTLKGGNLSLEASGPDYGRFNRLFGMPGRLGGSFTTSLNMAPNEDGRERVEFAANTADIQVRMDSLLSSADNFVGTTLQLEITGPNISTVASAAGIDDLQDENFRITASVEKDADGYLVRSFEGLVDDDVLKITGHIGDQPFLGETNLEIDFAGTNLGESVLALGAPAEELPKGAYYLKGGVQKRDGKLWLQDILAAIGEDEEYRFELSGFLTPDEQFAGSEVHFQAHGDSVAALAELAGLSGVPDIPFEINTLLRRGRSNSYFENGVFKSGIVVVDFAGHVGDAPLQDDMELTFNASVPRMKDVVARFGIDTAMFPEGDLIASGSVRQVNGKMSAEQIAASFAGAKLTISGEFGQIPSLDGTKLKFELDGDDLSRLLPPNVSGASLAHVFSASGRVSLDDSAMEVERFRANIGHTTLAADIDFDIDPFFGSGKFNLKVDSPDIHQILPKLNEISVPLIAKLKYRGNGDWADNYWNFENSRLEMGEGFLEISGSLDGPPTFERTDLQVEWVASSANKLSVLAGRELPDEPLHLTARLVGTRDVMTMEKFELTFGESDLHGQLTMRAGEIPAVSFAANSRLFDISGYMPPPEEEKESTTPVADERVIPDTPLPLELLRLSDADVDIKIDELRTRSLRLFGLELDASISDGALNIRNLSYTGSRDGSLVVSANLIPTDSGGADFALKVDAKDIALAIRAGSEDDLQKLPLMQMRAELTGSGATVRDLAGTLDGYVRAAGGDGRIPAGSLSFLAKDFVTELINTVNPFSKSDPYTNVECSAILLHFENGVLKSDPVYVQQTDKLRIFANANIDLKTEKLDANFKIVPRKGLGISLSGLVNPYIKVTGTLGKPALVIDPEGALIEGSLAVATAGLSILAKSFKNRFLSDKDPCGTALADADEKIEMRKRDE